MLELQIKELRSLVKSRKPKIELFAEEDRWYKLKGQSKWIPSVTTMLGAVLNKGYGFDKWMGDMPSFKIACQERDEAGKRGTIVHGLCEQLLLEGKVTIPEDILSLFKEAVSKRMMSFEKWVQSVKPNIITTEYKLAHRDVPWSGTPDIVCVMDDGDLCIIDIKTGGAYPTHALQLTCYKALWDAIFPEFKIDKIYGLYLKDTWKTKVAPLCKEYPYTPEVVLHIKEVWNWMQGGPNPQPKKKYPIKTSFKLKGDLYDVPF